MTTVSARGFTVIELMLFLGVTGALFAALMVGVNSNITQQRYKESVVNYSTFLQNQYSEVINTRNTRDNNWTCINGTIDQNQTGGVARGRTDCVLLGKAIEVIDDGKSVRTMPVIGVEPNELTSTSDTGVLFDYSPKAVDYNDDFVSVVPIDWGSSLTTVRGDSLDSSAASFLILRSPASGLIRVFAWKKQLPSNLADMIEETYATEIVTSCVEAEGLAGLSPTQSVSVDPRIAGPEGVVVKEADSLCDE